MEPQIKAKASKKGKSKSKSSRLPLTLFLISIVTLFGIIYLFPTVTGALVQTSLVEYGSLKVIDPVNCYFIRQETVVNAKSSGSIQYYFEEGELIRKGTKILDVMPSVDTYIVSENRVVSYYIDNQESLFTPDNIKNLSREEIKKLDLTVHDTKRESAVAGEPLYKLIDNSAWYALFWVGPEHVVKYKQGNQVTLKLPLGDLQGTISAILEDGEQWKIILAFEKYYPDMAKLRTMDAEVVTSDFEGLMVANESITTKDGKPGVFVKDISGEFLFTPVSVITSDGEYSLVESSFFDEVVDGKTERISTVEAYDEILNHPKGDN